MTTTTPAKSNDPETTVTADVFISNLLVMGSIPPVVTLRDLQGARTVHGDAYTDEMIDALRRYGIQVQS